MQKFMHITGLHEIILNIRDYLCTLAGMMQKFLHITGLHENI